MDESLTFKYLSYSSPSGFLYNLKRRLVATKAASIDQCWMSIRTKRCTIATNPVMTPAYLHYLLSLLLCLELSSFHQDLAVLLVDIYQHGGKSKSLRSSKMTKLIIRKRKRNLSNDSKHRSSCSADYGANVSRPAHYYR